jgi:hypothetical protein
MKTHHVKENGSKKLFPFPSFTLHKYNEKIHTMKNTKRKIFLKLKIKKKTL